jgi:hypothetical protein
MDIISSEKTAFNPALRRFSWHNSARSLNTSKTDRFTPSKGIFVTHSNINPH